MKFCIDAFKAILSDLARSSWNFNQKCPPGEFTYTSLCVSCNYLKNGASCSKNTLMKKKSVYVIYYPTNTSVIQFEGHKAQKARWGGFKTQNFSFSSVFCKHRGNDDNYSTKIAVLTNHFSLLHPPLMIFKFWPISASLEYRGQHCSHSKPLRLVWLVRMESFDPFYIIGLSNLCGQ